MDEQVRWAKEAAAAAGAAIRLFEERASAKTIVSRPECSRLLSLMEDGEEPLPEMLLATSFDRLSRDVTDTLVLARSLRTTGIRLLIRDRGIVPMETFADQAALVGQAMGGHAENDAKSARSRASWERRRREGKPTSNKVPYGLQLKAERDVPAPDSSEWVQRAFEWYASGLGMHTIALRMQSGAPSHRTLSTRLDSDGNRIVRERTPVWEPNRVKKMLVQPRYRGTIVEPEMYDQVQDLLRSKPRWNNSQKFEYPLSGAIKCAGCGRAFHGHATGGMTTRRMADGSRRKYVRSKRVRYYACTVCHFMINADTLESWFRDSICKIQARPELLEKWVKSKHPGNVNAHAEIERLQKIAGSFDERRRRAWELALDNEVVAEDLPRQLRAINAEEQETKARLADLLNSQTLDIEHQRTVQRARKLLQQFWQLYDTASYEQQRELSATLAAALGGATADKSGLFWRAQHALRPVSQARVKA